MMNFDDLERIDSKKMYAIYDDWPEIAKESINSNPKKFEGSGIDHIIFSGMGGSGSIGDVMSSVLSKEDIHVTVVKGYHLPNNLDSNSYSKNSNTKGW